MKNLLWVAVAIALPWTSAGWSAEKIPPLSEDAAVVFVSASGPGSGPDTLARTFIEVASKYTDQTFVVENRTGGSGLVARSYVMGRPADGHTVLVWTRSFTINHLTQPDAESPVDKLHYIGIAMFEPLVLFTYKDGPYADAKALLDSCKTDSQQRWGGAYPGSVDWLIVQRIFEAAGCEGQYVPFEDGASLSAAVMGKHISVGSGGMVDVTGRGDRLTPLLQSGAERDQRMPDVPTLKELGYDVVERQHRGFVALAGIPQEAKDFYAALMSKVIRDSDYEAFLQQAVATVGEGTSEEMEQIVRKDQASAIELFEKFGLLKK